MENGVRVTRMAQPMDVADPNDPVVKTGEELRQLRFTESSQGSRDATIVSIRPDTRREFSVDPGTENKQPLLVPPPLKFGYTSHISRRELMQNRDI